MAAMSETDNSKEVQEEREPETKWGKINLLYCAIALRLLLFTLTWSSACFSWPLWQLASLFIRWLWCMSSMLGRWTPAIFRRWSPSISWRRSTPGWWSSPRLGSVLFQWGRPSPFSRFGSVSAFRGRWLFAVGLWSISRLWPFPVSGVRSSMLRFFRVQHILRFWSVSAFMPYVTISVSCCLFLWQRFMLIAILHRILWWKLALLWLWLFQRRLLLLSANRSAPFTSRTWSAVWESQSTVAHSNCNSQTLFPGQWDFWTARPTRWVRYFTDMHWNSHTWPRTATACSACITKQDCPIDSSSNTKYVVIELRFDSSLKFKSKVQTRIQTTSMCTSHSSSDSNATSCLGLKTYGMQIMQTTLKHLHLKRIGNIESMLSWCTDKILLSWCTDKILPFSYHNINCHQLHANAYTVH